MRPETRRRDRWRATAVTVSALVFLGMGSRIEGRMQNGIPARVNGLLGVRAVAADFAWIGVQSAWERRDPLAATAAIRRALAWDPDRMTFWLNGARMIAYDMPAWRIDEASGEGVLLGSLAGQWRREQALQALALLDTARTMHPDDVNLLIEMGNIELWALGNGEGAARLFGLAAKMPEAPAYALRLEVALLLRMGRGSEARRTLADALARANKMTDSSRSLDRPWIQQAIEQLDREL